MQRIAAYGALYPRLLRLARGVGPVDVVVTKTDPPLLLLLGPLIARRRTLLVHWAQDLYPEVAEALGVLPPEGLVTSGLRALSTWALKRSDAIVAIGVCMRARLEARGVAPDRMREIPNWTLGNVHPVPHEANAWRHAQGLDARFVVMYSGNMGLAHPFEAMLDAAALLQREASEVAFVFAGNGARKAWIEAQVQARGLGNVQVLPFQPAAHLAESLSAADVHLVSMEAALEGLVVPSKIYGIAAAGRPCVFLGPPGSEAAHFVRQGDWGDVLPEATGRTLADALLAWKHDPARCREAGRRAAEAAQTSREASLARFTTLLQGLCPTPPHEPEGRGPGTRMPAHGVQMPV